MTVWVGTSGWQYASWKRRFYPQKMPQRQWLAYFSARFPTVEVNNSFYRLPEESSFERWRRESADGFLVTVKASRYITHIKRLADPKDPVKLFWSRAKKLGPKLGPVLFQLPPNFKADHERLEGILRVLPKTMRPAFEFREATWETQETYDLLDAHGAAFVLADRPGWEIGRVVTGGWSYIRFHEGRRTSPFYARSKLRRWADRIAELPADDVFVYFNNDPMGAAIKDAHTMMDLLEERGLEVVRAAGDEAAATSA